MGDFSDGEASSIEGVVLSASHSAQLVVAEVHVPSDAGDVGACLSAVPLVLPLADGSPRWEVVAPPVVDAVSAGAGHGFIMVLKKDARYGWSQQARLPMDSVEACAEPVVGHSECAGATPCAPPGGPLRVPSSTRPPDVDPFPIVLASGVVHDFSTLSFHTTEWVLSVPWDPTCV